jgi:L-glyceraldehyde 3-phosphate reductase
MFDRWIEDELLDVLGEQGIGCAVFSPLAQGMLTDKYIKGIPDDSRAARPGTFLDRSRITEERRSKIRRLNELAKQRHQTLAQMALAWVLRDARVTSAIIGASKVKQIEEGVAALQNLAFTEEELRKIDQICPA